MNGLFCFCSESRNILMVAMAGLYFLCSICPSLSLLFITGALFNLFLLVILGIVIFFFLVVEGIGVYLSFSLPQMVIWW